MLIILNTTNPQIKCYDSKLSMAVVDVYTVFYVRPSLLGALFRKGSRKNL